MKIVHLVLLLSIAGATAACSGESITASQDVVSATQTPSFDGSSSDTTVTRDSGNVFGSGH